MTKAEYLSSLPKVKIDNAKTEQIQKIYKKLLRKLFRAVTRLYSLKMVVE